MSLQGRKTAIIGGSSGIGRATAALLAERGAEVTLGGRDEKRLAAAAEALPADTKTIPVDATDRGSLKHFYEKAGPIDDLVVTVTRRGGAGPQRTSPSRTCLAHSRASQSRTCRP